MNWNNVITPMVVDPEQESEISIDDRIIIIPEELQVIGVQTDNNVERIYFSMPRFYDGTNDLSTFNLYVNYINALGNGNVYYIDDVDATEDTVSFSWLTSRHLYEAEGTVQFSIRAFHSDGRRWNTAIAEMEVLPGLVVTETIEEDDYDFINQQFEQLNELTKQVNDLISEVVSGQESLDANIAINNQKIDTAINTMGKAQWSGSMVRFTDAVGGYSDYHDIEGDFISVSQLDYVKQLLGINSKVYGLQADFTSGTYTRIGDSLNFSAGTDFDTAFMFGGRKRCNVSDDGTITAYYGEEAYTEDGSNGQVMVYQPKFYYKVVPIDYEPIENGVGYHLRKANYFVTDKPTTGFKLHPAFINKNGEECDYILLGAYEGCLYDTSASTYLNSDEQVMNAEEDKLSSIADSKPASGLTQLLTRPNLESMAQNRGENWHLMNIQAISANQLLMAIELGGFNFQTLLGLGVTAISDNSAYNCSSLTGSTSSLGNVSGVASQTTNTQGDSQTVETASNKVSVTYRGMENPYGNIWDFIYGINAYVDTSTGEHQAYICNDLTPKESKKDGNYEGAGFTIAKTNGYVSALGYNEKYDWLMIASETLGNSSSPIGDYMYQNTSSTGFRVARLGGFWDSGANAGGFCWSVHTGVGSRGQAIGGRLVYIPVKNI